MAFSPDLGIIPLVWAILTFLNILFCYFYAVAVGHVYPFVPSISNTGAKRPEGNIFAEGMNISSFVCLLIMAIRYHQLKYRAGRFSENLERVNCLSLISGLVSMFGVTLIANFPSSKVRLFRVQVLVKVQIFVFVWDVFVLIRVSGLSEVSC